MEFNFDYVAWLRFYLETDLMEIIHSGRDFTLPEREILHPHLSDYWTVTCTLHPQLTMMSELNNFSCCQGPLEFVISNQKLVVVQVSLQRHINLLTP